ncbi:hypothetical protein [Nitrosomonas sp. Nm33]|uniref:hypothetical protein n=1 Tax=Nitrosomonas sp. Nm33 TaxID=133724 RepID=UPI00403F903E
MRQAAEILLLRGWRSAHCECEAANFVRTATNLDVLGHAFKVIIELACCNFASSNSCRAHGGFGMVLVDEKCVAARVYTLSDSNGTCMAITVEIVCAFDHATFRNKRGFDGNSFHLKFSYCVKEESNGVSENL